MRQLLRFRTIPTLITLATVIYAITTKQSHGTFIFVPFEFRVPTIKRIQQRWWNPEDGRVLTPHVFGVGWSVNVYQVGKKLGILGNNEQDE